ncbi:MAG: recombinase family protein, partial [Sulfitobacter sp.]|nr:recombinase family protein [Sulfitobacter sp.]
MKTDTDKKISEHHLQRKALVYVRQSTMKQVRENTASTARQYQLVDTAIALGWHQELIHVIDEDLGKSARSAAHRHGFQKLVADVALGQVGIVMGLEISRLARNNADFQQLLQLCGTNNTLIYDADALYDLMCLNDRLVLGFKGTLSDVELFTLKARLQGGALSKASRGELRTKLPIGFVYTETGQVVLDPDRQVQETIQLFFQRFRKIGSSIGVVKHFNRQGIAFPTRPIKGPHKGELRRCPLASGLALRILHNPRYAGAYSYGRTELRKSPSGRIAYAKRERDRWHALIKDAHPAYISRETFEANQTRLEANRIRQSPGSAREGRGLLQGIVLCGQCGKNLATTYKTKPSGECTPVYLCNRDQLDYGHALCTRIPGVGIDAIVTNILLEKVTPIAVKAAISVQQEIVKRAREADQLLHRQVERAQYDADPARRCLMAVDPANRFVAQTLEQEWNEKLRLLEQARHDYEAKRQHHHGVLESAKDGALSSLAGDFADLWHHPATRDQDKKRMIRLLIEDVTLTRHGHHVDVAIRFKTGTLIHESVRIARSGQQPTDIGVDILQRIEHLSRQHTAGEIAKILNEAGVIHPTRGIFDTNAIVYLMKRFHIPSLKQRLTAAGFVAQQELAERCGVTEQTVLRWRRRGWIRARRYNDQPEYLYEPKFDALPLNVARRYDAL